MTPLILAALPQELASHFGDIPTVMFTGVGKVNAARVAQKGIMEHRPKMVVNFGTCGSYDREAGALVSCVQFVQTDMKCMALGFDAGVTPFETVPMRLEIPYRTPGIERARCLTQDRFVKPPYDPDEGAMPEVFDMEAYAIAKVCFFEKVPFICVKYVTDAGDPAEWEKNCGKAAEAFRSAYDELFPRKGPEAA